MGGGFFYNTDIVDCQIFMRKTLLRLSLIRVLTAASFCAASYTAPVFAQQKIDFDIPPQSADAALTEFARLAKETKSPVVRRHLASALGRTPVKQRSAVLIHLLARSEDVEDHNLPLLYWYATEPVVAADKTAAIVLLSKTKIPKVRQFITRRLASK
mgnify:CR=1 FL=1